MLSEKDVGGKFFEVYLGCYGDRYTGSLMFVEGSFHRRQWVNLQNTSDEGN